MRFVHAVFHLFSMRVNTDISISYPVLGFSFLEKAMILLSSIHRSVSFLSIVDSFFHFRPFLLERGLAAASGQP